MHQTNKKSVCLQPNTRSTKVTSRKEAKVSNQKRCICHVHQASMGFGQRARRWVSMMLQNTTATAAFNGWRSASFPERSGVQQGSPLSPLLYVLAAQPFASHIRHQTRQSVIRSITMPDGQPAPVSHQHADDTTIHVLQPSDAQVALDSSTALFCAATCSQLNVSKSRGFLVQAQPLASAVVAALPSISFFTGQQTIKHLGVLLAYAMQAASHQQFTGIDHAISTKDRPCHHGWSSWRQDILLAPCGDCLPWTDRLGTRFLGRCSGSNQVRSVPSSADGGWTIPL